MSGYSEGWGQPPMNCNICGGRVRGEMCDRHMREPGFIALRDKYVGVFVTRTPRLSSDQRGSENG